LLDHVQQKSINLSQVQVLVLDEADRMLDMGFLPDLQRIINLLPKERQNLLFSATFSPEIQKLARSFMKQPLLIEVARRNATSENIRQVIFSLNHEDEKSAAVAHLIASEQLKQVIVFSNTKLAVSRLSRHLEALGVAATAIHGDKSQLERMKALEAFKAGEVAVLVATDVAARGLDIPALPCVINFDLPSTPEDYVHRIGRTGRAGAKGTAYSFTVKSNDRALKDIEKLIGKAFVCEELKGFEPRARVGAKPSVASVARGPSRDEPRTPRPARERTYIRSRFDDNAPIDSDAEYERLRAKLSRSPVRDALFHQPYQERDVAAGDGQQGADAGVGFSRAKKNKVGVPVLLGGGPTKRS
jgi:superfamily II DNA/RNA helicase